MLDVKHTSRHLPHGALVKSYLVNLSLQNSNMSEIMIFNFFCELLIQNSTKLADFCGDGKSSNATKHTSSKADLKS